MTRPDGGGASARPTAPRRPLRVVSLVPSATEIVFALGAGDLLVGVSHECDHPPAARRLPQLTGSALGAGLGPAAVDAAVSAQLAAGESLYTLDAEKLAALDADLVLTQELCPVCAVSTAQVDAAFAAAAPGSTSPAIAAMAPAPAAVGCPEVLSLDPHTLADVLDDIVRVGERIGRRGEAADLVATLRARLAACRAARDAARGERPPPRVLALEWLEPPFGAGHWVPEMIAAAGGEAVLAAADGRSTRLEWTEIAAADPDLILAVPCGFDADGAALQVQRLTGHPEWERLRAVGAGRVLALDANGLWSRPGPRLVDGVETLAAALAALPVPGAASG